jgi:hypothetical protein
MKERLPGRPKKSVHIVPLNIYIESRKKSIAERPGPIFSSTLYIEEFSRRKPESLGHIPLSRRHIDGSSIHIDGPAPYIERKAQSRGRSLVHIETRDIYRHRSSRSGGSRFFYIAVRKNYRGAMAHRVAVRDLSRRLSQ